MQRVTETLPRDSCRTCQGRCGTREGCDQVTCPAVRGLVGMPGWASTERGGDKQLPQQPSLRLTRTRMCPPAAFPAGSESPAADTRVPRAPFSPRPPRPRRSPEAGGELARGFQAGVAGGRDFVLGANLPAGRGVGVLKKKPQKVGKRKRRW